VKILLSVASGGGYEPVTSFTKQTGHMVYSLGGKGKEELADALGTNQCHG
jgi:hypothetical protein